jgi:hypothetical protein
MPGRKGNRRQGSGAFGIMDSAEKSGSGYYHFLCVQGIKGMDPANEFLRLSQVMKRLIFFLLIAQKIQSQHNDYGNWLSFQFRVELPKKWEWHNDAGYRTGGSDWQASQFFYRTGLRYNLSNKQAVTAGLALFYTSLTAENEYRVYGEERRIWQEYVLENSKKKWQFQMRFRMEERFFQAVSNKSARYATRLRMRVHATRFFNEQWGIQMANEYMVQFDEGSGKFNQNRLTISGLYKVKRNWQFQLGYMFLLLPYYSQHVLILSVQKKVTRNDN